MNNFNLEDTSMVKTFPKLCILGLCITKEPATISITTTQMSYIHVNLVFALFLVALGVTESLLLVQQALYHLSYASNPICFTFFMGVGLCFCSGKLDCNSPIYASCMARMTGMCHHTPLLLKMGVSLTFCLGWPGTVVLPISTPQMAGIIDTSQHA
jgi:hypothetical protein